MSLSKKGILSIILLITLQSCDRDLGPIVDRRDYTISEYWSLSISAAGNQDCNYNYKLFYIDIPKDKEGHYRFPYITPVDLASGRILPEETIWPAWTILADSFDLKWADMDIGLVNCTGNIVENEISSGWTCTAQRAECTWQSEKGLVDAENGSFEKDITTGRTRLYFCAWTEGASRVYITADFIDGQVELVKCGKTKLYTDIWKISGSPVAQPSQPPIPAECASEGFYEFPSTSTPLVVKTHIVKPTGEVVREKTITEGIELNARTN